MGEAFITRRGGGSGKAFAAISVTYPAGSVCTCSNGSKVLKAKDTSGSFLFLIPYAGVWTVIAGSQSQAVNVNIANNVYFVKFFLPLFQNGKLAAGFTLSDTLPKLQNGKILFNMTGAGVAASQILPAIDMSGKSLLRFKAKQTAAYVGSPDFGIRVGLADGIITSQSAVEAISALTIYNTVNTGGAFSEQYLDVDISAYNKVGYVTMAGYADAYVSEILVK